MGDFGDDEYPNMICVEAGHVSSAVTLNPGETFKGGQVLAVVQWLQGMLWWFQRDWYNSMKLSKISSYY